jgi:hypothetical protein
VVGGVGAAFVGRDWSGLLLGFGPGCLACAVAASYRPWAAARVLCCRGCHTACCRGSSQPLVAGSVLVGFGCCACFRCCSAFGGGWGDTRCVRRGGVRAGVLGGVVGGAPSTLWALVGRRDPFEAGVAAGRLLLPEEGRAWVLLLAGVPVHFGISAGWGVVLARVLPSRGTVVWGAVAGGVIATVDLRMPGRRAAAVRALPVFPQVVDHVVFGAVVGIYLRRRALRLP